MLFRMRIRTFSTSLDQGLRHAQAQASRAARDDVHAALEVKVGEGFAANTFFLGVRLLRAQVSCC